MPVKKKLSHKLCDNYNQLKMRRIQLSHKLRHKLRKHRLSCQAVL